MAVGALVLFAAMFLLVFVVRSVVQKRGTGDSGIRAGVLGSSFGSLEWFAGWLLVLAMLSAIVAPVAELVGVDPLTGSNSIRGMGAVVASIGTILIFLAQMNMGEQWRIGVDESERTQLVNSGAFRLVRNPIFSAMILTAAGLAVMVPNPISIAGLALLVVAIELQVRFVEEPYLRRLHGSEYKGYSERVGRFVPGVGRT